MRSTDVTFAGAIIDAHGRNVIIYQDHDGVRIDVGAIEIMLTSVTPLIKQLAAAQERADEWYVSQAARDV